MKPTIVSLFSGGGGLDLGFTSENYEILWAIDNEKNAVDTYKENIGDHILLADINEVDLNIIPKCDIIIGGPPCQSFSLAGNRNTEDSRGQLVWKYIEIIEKVNPKAFLFENVTGLVSAKTSEGKNIIDQLFEAFQNIGYTINWSIMNAADYGVPQKRKRVIIVGLKEKEKFRFPTPTHSPNGEGGKRHISVKEALDDLPETINDINSLVRYKEEPKTTYQKLMRNGVDSVSEHYMPQMSDLDKYIISHVKPGGNYMDIPPEVDSKRIRRLQKEGGRTTCYGRMCPDNPSYTINTYFNRPNVGCNIHYSKDRLISVREALRLQSFPDSYKIISSSKQGRHSIVGNAVPPILSQSLAKELKKYL